MGTLDEATSFWYWAWAAEATSALKPGVLLSARTLREYGTKHEIPELTYEQIALGVGDDRPWFNAGFLVKIACHLCAADFAISGGSSEQPKWKEFWLVKAPGILPDPDSVSRRIFFVIKEAIETWGPGFGGCNARKAVAAYARQKNCTVSDSTGQKLEWANEQQVPGGRRTRIDDPAGDTIYVDFDATGEIAGMGYPPPRAHPPPEKSWFKRLLRQRTKDK
jgi:hypothetical protein